jgi:hypothetical protein
MKCAVATLLETGRDSKAQVPRPPNWGARSVHAVVRRYREGVGERNALERPNPVMQRHHQPLHPPKKLDREGLKVSKKLAPTQPGAIKLARHYGDALLCVRRRRSADGRQRLTTVELIVECVPVHAVRSGGRANPQVGVRIGFHETELRARVRAVGSTWDHKSKLWRIRRSFARQLDLLDRVVES